MYSRGVGLAAQRNWTLEVAMGTSEGQDPAARLGIGVVGLGRISSTHIDALKAHDGAKLVAVCDTDAPTVRDVATREGVRGYEDYRDLLADPAVDAVLLLLPHELHHPIGMDALRARKHVCMEKPLAVTTEQCRELVDAAGRANLLLSVTQNTRFVPAYVSALRAFREGQIGDLRLIRTFNGGSEVEGYLDDNPRDAWRRARNGIGTLIDVNLHYFYLLHWFFGDVANLHAITRNAIPAIGVDDYALVSGEFRTGGAFAVEATLTAELPWQERLEIYGTKGAITVDHRRNPPAIMYHGYADTEGTPLPDVPFDPKGWRSKSIVDAVHDFVDGVAVGKPQSVALDDATYAVTIVEKSEESNAKGGIAVAF
jgi:predicted dehydrogenase